MSNGNEGVAAFLVEWTRAERDGDATALDRLLVDDFVGVGPLGFVLSKQDWLKRFAQGLHYDEFSLDDPQVRRYSGTAIVVGQQNQSGTFGSEPIPFASVRATLMVLDRSGGWRLAGCHMSFIAGTAGVPAVPDQ